MQERRRQSYTEQRRDHSEGTANAQNTTDSTSHCTGNLPRTANADTNPSPSQNNTGNSDLHTDGFENSQSRQQEMPDAEARLRNEFHEEVSITRKYLYRISNGDAMGPQGYE